MTTAFAKAFGKVGIESQEPDESQEISTDPQKVPMMYRAQIEGRCQLHRIKSGKKDSDAQMWAEEWVNSPNGKDNNHQPRYQHTEPTLGVSNQGEFYQFMLKFPHRVATNDNRDSIFRPVIGTKGIPWIPGSSIKGLFLRLTNSELLTATQKEQIQKFCGSTEASGTLRFHGAYPIGDWAGAEEITFKDQNGKEVKETTYRMMDVVHPQQKHQVESKAQTNANALVSFYQPTFVFKLSSKATLTLPEWQAIESLLKQALQSGLGGKTSSGYGYPSGLSPKGAIQLKLEGKGVSPTLRSGVPEFRPNMFKASLRSHASRLLGGVCSDEKVVKQTIERLFGHTKSPGMACIRWYEESRDLGNHGSEKTVTFNIKGILALDIDHKVAEKLKKNSANDIADTLAFLKIVLQFAYVMGGFGKSWRRASHSAFMQDYKTREIGCHWLSNNLEWNQELEIHNVHSLTTFLNRVHESAKSYISSTPGFISTWRESWHPDRLVVYAKVVQKSEAIRLFHNPTFKSTIAIGGRKETTNQETGKTQIELLVSLVWHRMLPIKNNQYLEIITIFHGPPGLWKHKSNIDQYQPFVSELKDFTRVWGQPR
jgi:CRISPR-associated protein Cmr6